jgi:alanine racemase
MSIRIQNIVPIIKAKAYGNTSEAVIDTVSIDSRSLQNSSILFFALVGPNNDAYIEDLIATGAKLCGTRIPEGCAGKANFLIVETL